MNNNPVILFRQSFHHREAESTLEWESVNRHFSVYQQRTDVHKDSLVVGRYSVLPYYKELEKDLENRGCTLINSFSQHRWIANFDYYDVPEIRAHTFETWTDRDFYCAPEGKFVLKGRTNSRKHQWDTHMYANSKREAADVASRLINDGLIGSQGILYRRYTPLRTFEVGLNGLPFTNEWRFFCLGNKVLSSGFYWSTVREDLLEEVKKNRDSLLSERAWTFVYSLAGVVSKYVNFFVLDIGETVTGDWKLIEINDGQMSGLSENDPDTLYHNLRLNLDLYYESSF